MRLSGKPVTVRGLPYLDRPARDDLESRGVLAADVELSGFRVPAGSEVWRDIDFDNVWVRLVSALTVDEMLFPAGSTFSFPENPRSLHEWPFVVAIKWPVVLLWFTVIGTAELITGKWNPIESLRSPRGPKLRAVVWPGGPMEIDGTSVSGPGDRIFLYVGSVEVCPASE